MNNLSKRTFSGILFVAVMAGSLLLHPLAYTIVFCMCVGIMVIEFYRMMVGNQNTTGQILGFLASLLLFVGSFLLVRYGWVVVAPFLLLLFLSIFAVWITTLVSKQPDAVKTSALLFLPLLYIALPFSTCSFMVFTPQGLFAGEKLLALFIIIWASDVGGYVIGSLFGQKHGHKLCPRLSPYKSWEGLVGSVVFALSAGVVMQAVGWLPIGWNHALVLSLLMCITGVLGDLTESEIKRSVGVKDSGKIIPGHGGLLDRFDGALFALPTAAIYLMLISL